MSSENPTKINRLLSSVPSGVVLQSAWLVNQGYSLELQKRYRKSQWLQSIGNGAMIRSGDEVNYEGAIYALQVQSGSSIHPGGRTALALLGKSHYLEFASKKVTVFGHKGEQLPAWFRNHDWWGKEIDYHQSSFLPPDIGMKKVDLKNYSIEVSGMVRAMLECLYLAPEKQELLECYELMEGLNNPRPNQVQELLEQCNSVKVKRLFLYLAEKAGHSWLQYLDVSKIELGSGKRSIVKNGIYNHKYKITIPKELDENGK